MRLVAVSRVRNEADIIEAFVRHHARYFDWLVIVDDGSTDGTHDMLCSLQAEGLPLEVFREPVVGYEQSRYMTRLLHTAVDRFADWVVPLDADEFIEPPDGRTLAETLAEREPQLLSIPWANFAWSADEDDKAEPNPVVRQRLRVRPGAATFGKVVVPACLIDEQTRLSQGSHRLIRNGEEISSQSLELIQLCHYPIRSVEQYASKIAIGFLQYSAMPDWGRDIGFHYIAPFQALLTGGLEALRERMAADSHHYSVPSELQQDKVELADAPLRYHGGALKLPIPAPLFIQSVLHCAQAIARDRAAWVGRRTNEDQ